MHVLHRTDTSGNSHTHKIKSKKKNVLKCNLYDAPSRRDEADAEKSLGLVLEQAWGDGLGLWLSCTASPPGGIWQQEPVAFPAGFST